MPRILILNGPNLNRLGTREPQLYGSATLADVEGHVRARFPASTQLWAQHNQEGDLIEAVHTAVDDGTDAIIINAGAYAHTSIALMDALRLFPGPKVEVHISNTAARESFRRHSYVATACTGSITGLGTEGYALAVQWVLAALTPKQPK